jgi:outer membrane lipoprotein SlyB
LFNHRQGKFVKKEVVLLLCAVGVAGCATQPAGVTTEQSKAFVAQGMAIGKLDGAGSVRVKTKGQAVAGAVIGAVAGSLASSPTSMTAQGLQQGQEAGMVANSVAQTTVNDATGHVRQDQTPAEFMADYLKQAFGKLSMPADKPVYHVDIQQATWLLDYDSLFGSDNYRLHWQLTAKVVDANGDTVTRSQCQGEGDTKQSLDSWKAGDYAQVKKVAGEVGIRCAKQFLGDIGVSD